MSSKPASAVGYANIKQLQRDLTEEMEMGLISGGSQCAKCNVAMITMADGATMCPHCNAVMGRCKNCAQAKPVFLGECGQCRTNKIIKAQRKLRWGEKRGNVLNFFSEHADGAAKWTAVFSLLLIAVLLLVPLVVEVEHLLEMGKKMADDVEGGVAPILTEGGRVLGYAGRNTASALRILETPLNFTDTVLEDAETIVGKIFDAISNPTAAFVAYNRVTGTTIICDDGTEYSWKPMVMRSGVVTNPYSACVLHQMKLNGEDHARFFPGEPPKRGDDIGQERTQRRVGGVSRGIIRALDEEEGPRDGKNKGNYPPHHPDILAERSPRL